MSLDHIFARASALLQSRQLKNPQTKTAILCGALVFLVIGIVLSLRQQPNILADLNWWPVVVVMLIAVPVTACLNAIVFMVTGGLIGQTIPFVRALEITIIGTAANMLPLPGGTVVRVAGLKLGGAGYKDATAAVLFVTVTWFGVALAYAGVAAFFTAPRIGAMVLLIAGVVILLITTIAPLHVAGGVKNRILATAVTSLLVVVEAVRLLLCLSALGTEASFAQVSVLTISSVIGTAVSIVPAGLGIREALAAALSPMVGLAVASGFLAAALNRLLALFVIVPMASLLTIRSRRRTAS